MPRASRCRPWPRCCTSRVARTWWRFRWRSCESGRLLSVLAHHSGRVEQAGTEAHVREGHPYAVSLARQLVVRKTRPDENRPEPGILLRRENGGMAIVLRHHVRSHLEVSWQ